MKTLGVTRTTEVARILNWALVLGCVSSVWIVMATGQGYGVDWFKIGGGGGTSSQGGFSVSGTIGQPEAGARMTGGGFTVTGGFWSVVSVVQTPGAPLLSISRTDPNTMTVYWPSSAAGFQIQQTIDLTGGNWSTAVEDVNDNGTNKFIVVSPTVAGKRFYRLIKP